MIDDKKIKFLSVIKQAIDEAKPIQQEDVKPLLRLRNHADRLRDRSNPPPMLIEGIVPLGAVAALVALPGVGKSLVGVEIARCVAGGDAFAGRTVHSGRVIYACPDSPASTERRMLAIVSEVADKINTVCDFPPMPGSIDLLRRTVEAINATAGDPVCVVIIDTWDASRSHSDGGYAGQDGLIESIMSELRRLAADLELSVVLIHHSTRGETGRARGSLVFDARADFIGSIEADKSPGRVKLTATKNRDGELGPVGAWRIVPVEVEGESVPTLVADNKVVRPSTPTDNQLRLLNFIANTPGKHTAATLVEKLDLSSKGVLSRLVENLRTNGLMEKRSYSLTTKGQESVPYVERDDQHLETPVPGRFLEVRDDAGRSVKSMRPAGTINRDAHHRPTTSPCISMGGPGRDDEDAFANAPIVPGMEASYER